VQGDAGSQAEVLARAEVELGVADASARLHHVTTLDRDMLRRLSRARALLRSQRERPPTVRAVAEEVAISHFHFIRRFEQVFGWTPSQFRIHARLEHAKELLERGELSVTETCLAVGFASPASFSALFRARVGIPPPSSAAARSSPCCTPGPSCPGAWV
jgi:AraC-like DNA-binding protein